MSQPIIVTMGDPAGIGGEITLKAWRTLSGQGPAFAVLHDAAFLQHLARSLALDVPVLPIAALNEADSAFARGLPVLNRPLSPAPKAGQPNGAHALAVIAAIDEAIELASSGAAAALVTNPIHKAGLYAAGFSAPGHTEYLAMRLRAARPVMMLAIPDLRVVPVSVHVSLADAVRTLTQQLIEATARALDVGLRQDFGIARPRIAIAALNPHAGEDGALGREEIEIIRPACAALLARGLRIEGPLPADTLFHEKMRGRFDVVVCMYHDQALIPLKTIDFARGVNITLGLPIIRTSPDHGTAFDIAGTGKADPSSLIEAIKLAARLAQNRGRAIAGG